jgi:hypothetical protein
MTYVLLVVASVATAAIVMAPFIAVEAIRRANATANSALSVNKEADRG